MTPEVQHHLPAYEGRLGTTTAHNSDQPQSNECASNTFVNEKDKEELTFKIFTTQQLIDTSSKIKINFKE